MTKLENGEKDMHSHAGAWEREIGQIEQLAIKRAEALRVLKGLLS